jgi:TetR/AcrR family transcriptional regulator, lmrAB and yxaGH operons repressor
LYHHFPGGKAEMMEATIAYSRQWMVDNLLRSLQSEGAALARFQRMCDLLNQLYEGGKQPCLLIALTLEAADDWFHLPVKEALQTWIAAIAAVLSETGLDPSLAQRRAEIAVTNIQGSLILSRGLDDPTVFQRAIARIPQALCEDLPL